MKEKIRRTPVECIAGGIEFRSTEGVWKRMRTKWEEEGEAPICHGITKVGKWNSENRMR